MNDTRDFDRAVARWLDDSSDATPPRVVDAVLLAVKTTPQERDLRILRSASSVPMYLQAAAVLAIVAIAGVSALYALGLGPNLGLLPSGDPPNPFEGTWVSTSDADGGTQTMTVTVSADEAVEIVVHDDVATVCGGTPSTMTGTGRIESGTQLVIPAPVYTCDDGSAPETLSGPPLDEQLRDWTLVLHAETDTLADNFGGQWLREGAEDLGPAPAIPDSMWPQTSIEDLREAQEAADAGDPAYTWQVDPQLSSDEWWAYLRGGGAEIVQRFLQEELGWDHGQFSAFSENGGGDGVLTRLVYLRCAPGETNPLYPIPGQFDAEGGDRCAPTIDALRYETVSLDLAQLDRRGSAGIWVVSRWSTAAPFAQTDPIAAEAEARARLEEFLAARVAGGSVEGYAEVPLLYTTTSGAPYERHEIELVSGPRWPFAQMEFTVRLFADGGETVVEQRFYAPGDVGLRFGYGSIWIPIVAPTTENGRPLPVRYSFLDGEVTAAAAWPWQESWASWGLLLDGTLEERLDLLGDPLPVETGCQPGPAPADAAALAASIESDPDLEATAPVAVSVGALDALRLDVELAPGASVCGDWGTPLVLTGNDREFGNLLGLDQGSRIRLYLIDAPDGSSLRILAIAIVAPEADFDRVVEVATPILDTVAFPAP